jgi:hypothetical protein
MADSAQADRLHELASSATFQSLTGHGRLVVRLHWASWFPTVGLAGQIFTGLAVHIAVVPASSLHAALPLPALLRTCQGSCQPALPRSPSWPGSTALPFLSHATRQSTTYNILLTICILSGHINKLGHIDFRATFFSPYASTYGARFHYQRITEQSLTPPSGSKAKTTKYK